MISYSPSLHQAISLAKCVIEFEIESPQVEPIPEGWAADLAQARAALDDLHRQFERQREEENQRRPLKPARSRARFERRKFG